MRRFLPFILRASVASLSLRPTCGECRNRCSGKGDCGLNHVCSCWPGHTGADCSLRVCPSGRAWYDRATSTDVAHASGAECSNGGRCRASSGACECWAPFTGYACERLECANHCSSRGICMSMKDFATLRDPGLAPSDESVPKYESNWDAEAIWGCACDDGYTGYDCSMISCPSGDDPLTTGQLDEVQLLQCFATFGIVRFGFNGVYSEYIPFNADKASLEGALARLSTLGRVEVSFAEDAPLCGTDTIDQVVSITFLENFGDVPRLQLTSKHMQSCEGQQFDSCGGVKGGVSIATDGSTLSSYDGTRYTLYASQACTKESAVCSNRGTCNYETGTCACFVGYGSSDRRGGSGSVPDCGGPGYHIVMGTSDGTNGESPNTQTNREHNAVKTVRQCPGELECYACACNTGFFGGDCSQRSCPSAPAWFDMPTADEVAHAEAECAGQGMCDHETGLCASTCRPGFEGSACQLLSCAPSAGVHGGPCRCLTMAEHALEAGYTYGDVPNDHAHWDHSMVRGCECTAGFTGAGCGQRVCPSGPDPESMWDVINGESMPTAPHDQYVCNNRGICNVGTGACECFPWYGSSDGQGRPGTNHDCGWKANALVGPM